LVKIIALQLRHLCQRLSGDSRFGRKGMEFRTLFSQLILFSSRAAIGAGARGGKNLAVWLVALCAAEDWITTFTFPCVQRTPQDRRQPRY
jgi:hypothetical protein